ncbi:MAG: hypothetical protein IJ111_01165 [Eggerthellaceae bacterium]|nr:hypothetical protein [Eggerthellaceae bacterium]
MAATEKLLKLSHLATIEGVFDERYAANSCATSDEAGLMSASDFTKLARMSLSANIEYGYETVDNVEMPTMTITY